jgi:replicative DNA helicase
MSRPFDELVIPQATEAEQALLACLLFEPALVESARARLSPEDFFLYSHGEIYRSMLACYDADGALTPTLIAADLRRRGLLDQVGGEAYLGEFWSGHVRFASPESLKPYLRRVKEAALLRRVVHLSASLQTQAQDYEPILSLLATAERELGELRSESIVEAPSTLGRDLNRVIDELERIQSSGEPPGLKTGFCDLDRAVHGYEPGLLYVIAAGSGEGKTTFALQSILRVCQDRRNGEAVICFVSLEMPRDKVALRLLQIASCVPDLRMRGGGMTTDDWRAVKDAESWLAGLKVATVDDLGGTLEEVRAHAADVRQRFGRLDLLIVDYVQMLHLADAPKHGIAQFEGFVLTKCHDSLPELLRPAARLSPPRFDY